jgi:hypothetical protein
VNNKQKERRITQERRRMKIYRGIQKNIATKETKNTRNKIKNGEELD